MSIYRRVARRRWLLVTLVCSIAISPPGWVRGSEVTLKDGTVLRGTVETPVILRGEREASVGFIKLDDGLRRVIFYKEQMQSFSEASPLTSFRPFRIKQPLGGQNPNLVVGHVVSIVSIDPFDELGQRKFVVKDSRGETTILQGITEINPEYIKVKALKYVWDLSIATQSVPPDVIEAVLRKAIDPKNVDDRLRMVRFFLQAEWYVQAGEELKAIAEEFPEVAGEVKEVAQLLEAAKARRRMTEIKLRRSAGQHNLAYELLRTFPVDDAPGEVLVEVRDLKKSYDTLIERMGQARRELEKLHGEIADTSLQAKLAPIVQEVTAGLIHVEAFDRLDPFLSLIDKSMGPEEKLGAAISGWAAGSAFAEPNMDRALRIWDGRSKIAEYLREPSESRRQRLLAELKSQETLSVDLAARVLEVLPPVAEPPETRPDEPTKVRFETPSGRTIEYSVQVPTQYSPFRSYPLIITLHGRDVSLDTQLAWWTSAPGFQAGRHGYIVIAPEYLSDTSKEFEHDESAQDAVLYALIDARRRFSIDSDRVFLSGHSMGADAAWDIGLAHPDLFAGVIPICGAPQKFSEFYWPNGEHTSFYIIDGERDGTNPEQNTKVMRRMMERYYDVLYVEFKGRGHENFSDEIMRLFDWMGRKTRRKFPLSFSCRTARASDNEFFYVSVDEFAPGMLMDPYNFDRKRMRPGQIEGKIIGTANSIQLTTTGPRRADIWISPGMLDLSQPVTVRANAQKSNPKLIAPDLEVLLEDFRVRADRQKMFYAKVSFPRL